ncbi:MAG: hypothetical protein A3G34_02250 [Candidatus Lindowbacteria bacterium RIFCSPLOWO2_12_FULL_62_27]|nr:MAG: hypothetical protein A3G34_02250 [Candidatus Lindowbacteria bacterium RIFCSPLOWO2_12_FULL_62_27]OGH61213.1 MAG: hypothetical protein A3I06_15540 [Candidatus Lindowbacteria bacterium RIFCSPLOWO2_02_FULL_62_12]
MTGEGKNRIEDFTGYIVTIILRSKSDPSDFRLETIQIPGLEVKDRAIEKLMEEFGDQDVELFDTEVVRFHTRCLVTPLPNEKSLRSSKVTSQTIVKEIQPFSKDSDITYDAILDRIVEDMTRWELGR